MAICSWCDKPMISKETITCEGNKVVEFPNGKELPSVPYPIDETQRCHDCNVKPGGYHHPGCDMERCPKCGGQLISCGHLDDGDETEKEDQ